MTTTAPYVAICATCGVRPFAKNDPKGLGYTLRRVGDWLYCAAHLPPQASASRSSSATPTQTIEDLERALKDAAASLRAAIETLDEIINADGAKLREAIDASDDVASAFETYQLEVERIVAALRKALAAQTPAPDRSETKRTVRPAGARAHRRMSQDDLLIDKSGAESHGGETS